MQNEMSKLYKQIQNLLIKLVPDNWNSIYLYASVMYGKKGEMYFYYFPKKIIKANPINCYEIADKFGIEESTYEKSLKKLYEYIKELNHVMGKKWTNLTIMVEENLFTIEYHFNDLIHSKYNDEQRRMIWCYKYLRIPLESMNLNDRMMVENYKEESNIKPLIYTETI